MRLCQDVFAFFLYFFRNQRFKSPEILVSKKSFYSHLLRFWTPFASFSGFFSKIDSKMEALKAQFRTL